MQIEIAELAPPPYRRKPHPIVGTNSYHRVEIGSEGGAEYRVTFEDTINPGDVSLLTTHMEGLTGTGAALVAREVSAQFVLDFSLVVMLFLVFLF